MQTGSQRSKLYREERPILAVLKNKQHQELATWNSWKLEEDDKGDTHLFVLILLLSPLPPFSQDGTCFGYGMKTEKLKMQELMERFGALSFAIYKLKCLWNIQKRVSGLSVTRRGDSEPNEGQQSRFEDCQNRGGSRWEQTWPANMQRGEVKDQGLMRRGRGCHQKRHCWEEECQQKRIS